jgi:formylglycine-generating enzyme required for sulfatase activity
VTAPRIGACVALLSGLACGCNDETGASRSTTAPSGATTSSARAGADVGGPVASVASAGASASAAVGNPGADGTTCEAELDPQVLPDPDERSKTREAQREAMVSRMKVMLGIDAKTGDALLEILKRYKLSGQGNPETTTHPMTRTECVEKRRALGVKDEREKLCGAPFMVPVYDPDSQRKEDASVCIDRYEFPGLPCEYPVTWVSTAQAIDLCAALGKRLCDAHEWEGACAGKLRRVEEEYDFRLPRDAMSGTINLSRPITWAYGPKKDHKKCGTDSTKSKECSASGPKCGSNTYPAGAFPECRSPFGVYDQHGNAAEHMLLPLKADQLGALGGRGVAEMKGSWFIFQKHEAHKDDCRWRANSWHDDEGLGHSNYHLGFRCCKDVRRSTLR